MRRVSGLVAPSAWSSRVTACCPFVLWLLHAAVPAAKLQAAHGPQPVHLHTSGC